MAAMLLFLARLISETWLFFSDLQGAAPSESLIKGSHVPPFRPGETPPA